MVSPWMKKHHFLNENRVSRNSIKLFSSRPCLIFHVWHLTCYIDAPWEATLKLNGQTFDYEIKVQALEDTSWMKPWDLARFVFVQKVSNNHYFSLLTEGFCFAQLFQKRSVILYSWVNEKCIVQKMHLLLNYISQKLSNVCSYIKRR